MAQTLFSDSEFYYANVGYNQFRIDKRYVNLQPLGNGSYGFVASAFDVVLNRMVAIKKIKDTCKNLLGGKRILRELKLLRHFSSHENVVTIIDIMTDPPNAIDFKDIYIVTNLFESDLEMIVSSRQTLTDQHYQFFLYQILRALKFVHSANVLHRDLKPSNLLVNANCDLAVCDFGLSRGFSGELAEPLTEYVVTRWYRAPELLCDNSHYGKAVDIWSVGCIFAEMINHAPLFKGDNPQHQLNEIIKKIGCPVKENLNFIQSKSAYNYVSKFQGNEGPQFSLLFPNGTSYLALDLLQKMLAFHPDERITVEDALRHPYLKDFHNQMPEPSCPRLFSFDFELTALHKYGLNNITQSISNENNHNFGHINSSLHCGQVATSLRSLESQSTSSMPSTLSGKKQKFQSASAKSFDGNPKTNFCTASKTFEGVSSLLSSMAQTLSRTKRQKRICDVPDLEDNRSSKGANYNPFPSLFRSNSTQTNQIVTDTSPTLAPVPLKVYRSHGSGSSTELAPLTRLEVQYLIFNEVVVYRPFMIDQYVAPFSRSIISASSRSIPPAVTPVLSTKSEYDNAHFPSPREQHNDQPQQAAPHVNPKTNSIKCLFDGSSAKSLFRSTQSSDEIVKSTGIFATQQLQPQSQPACQNSSSSKSLFSLGSSKCLFRNNQNDCVIPPPLNSNLLPLPQQQQRPTTQSSNSSKSFLGSGSAKSLFRGTSNEKSPPANNAMPTQCVNTSNSSKSFSAGSARSLFRPTASSDEKPPIGDKSNGRPVKAFLEGIVRSASLFKSSRNAAFTSNISSHSIESQTSQNFGILDGNETSSQTAGISGFSSKSLLSNGSEDGKCSDDSFSNMEDMLNEMSAIESLSVSRRSSIFSTRGSNSSQKLQGQLNSIQHKNFVFFSNRDKQNAMEFDDIKSSADLLVQGGGEINQHTSFPKSVEEGGITNATESQGFNCGDARIFAYSSKESEEAFRSEVGRHFFEAHSSTDHTLSWGILPAGAINQK